MTCRKCNHTAKKFGTYGKHRIQRYRCTSCSATFSDPAPASLLGKMRIDESTALRAVHCLLEGCSVRSTERLTGLHRDTILSLLVLAGKRCERLFASMRGLKCNFIQCDEIWTFCFKKQRRVRKDDPAEFGDQWVFVAIDEETKLVPAFVVGKRTRETTYEFLVQLRSHMSDERFQITTDGFHFYERGIEDVFAGQTDFAQLIKLYGDYGQFGNEKYSPGRITEVVSKIRDGRPDPEHISTSHCERQNLTMRMAMRRFTRLTNAFSKKAANLKAACALHFAFYNYCRVHASLRVTPAMEAGITNHVWNIAELFRTV